MRTLLSLLLIWMLIGCSQEEPSKTVRGNWQFLDRYGTYNEAWFGDSTYQTINRFVDQKMVFPYRVKNDTLYSVNTRKGPGLHPVAGIEWLANGSMVFRTGQVRDTLRRIDSNGNLLSNSDPFNDSLAFFKEFDQRYDAFMIRMGILTEEEVKKFRKHGELPEDIQQKMH